MLIRELRYISAQGKGNNGGAVKRQGKPELA